MAGSLHLAGIAKVTGIIIHPLSTGLFLSEEGSGGAPIKAILLLNPRYCNFLWPKSGREGGRSWSTELFSGRHWTQAQGARIAHHRTAPTVVEQSGNALPPGGGARGKARFPAFTFKTHFSLLRFPDVFEIEFHRSPIRTTGAGSSPRPRRVYRVIARCVHVLLKLRSQR